MKVKEVLEWTAVELGVGDTVKAYLSGEANEVGERETECLLTAYQLVESELALDYFPLTSAETFENTDGEIPFVSFEKDPVRILRVRAFDGGEEVPFTLYADRIAVEGKVVVEYRYAPKMKGVEDTCEVGQRVTKHMLVYGVAGNYLTAVGEYVQASVWEKKYKKAIVTAQGISKATRIASRRWV